MDLLSPLVVRLAGANIDRRTVDHVRRAGLGLAEVEDLWRAGIFKRVSAVTPRRGDDISNPSPGEAKRERAEAT